MILHMAVSGLGKLAMSLLLQLHFALCLLGAWRFSN